ncbi:hypothetical protein MNB_SM-7-475 [hydrothermal vent metagenome]|uniref:YcxB-like protein domain-containing protein n=1 Tax=hydrothermal vent metagenome TaxID=652676 RepID=A0A1W1BU59_9ZZZZ
MSKSITLTIEWNKERALQASKALYDYEMKHSPKRYIGWLFIAFMQFGIVALFKQQNPLLLLLSSLLVAYWYYGRWYLRCFFLKRYYTKQNFQKSVITISCDESSLDIADKILQWDDILQAIDTKAALLLQTKEEIFYIPFDAFENLDDLSSCMQLLKSKGKL